MSATVPRAGATEDATAAPGREIHRHGRLGELDPHDLASRFGTPLFVDDLDVIARRVGALRAALPPIADVAFAVKANPAIAVVAHLASLGLGADVSSGGELQAALAAGMPAGRIVVTGPGVRDDELRAAVQVGVRAITLESRGELQRLERIAAEAGAVPRVLLRAAAPEAAAAEAIQLIGAAGSRKFGMDEADLRATAREAARSPYLEPIGVHAFGASNVLDARLLVAHADRTVRLAVEIAADAGFALRIVDVGGGLGIPYADGDPELDIEALGRGLRRVGGQLGRTSTSRDTRLLLEPGRYLVGPAGAYLARVVDRKRIDGRDVVILDGGVHHVLRPALVRQEHRIVQLARGGRRGVPTGDRHGEGAQRRGPVTIAGPLCTGLDVLATAAPIAAPEVGDLVAVLDVGAYGYTESMPFFLSHPVPAEVAIRGRRAAAIRRRIEPDELLAHQRIPDWSNDS